METNQFAVRGNAKVGFKEFDTELGGALKAEGCVLGPQQSRPAMSYDPPTRMKDSLREDGFQAALLGDAVLEALGGCEMHVLPSRNGDLLPGGGVAAFAG